MEEIYSVMQRHQYDEDGKKWSVANRDPVVGGFDSHNKWSDYDVYLFKDLGDTCNKKALDFGCGPARHLVKYHDKFARYDGVDISLTVLDKAKLWLEHNGIKENDFTLYHCNGRDLIDVPDNTYDVVTSTICMQHICVYDIRKNLFIEFFRVLKSGGQISIQMAYGEKRGSKNYFENYFNAGLTNGGCDVIVQNPSHLEDDLTEIGYTNFNHYIRPNGPNDCSQNWIFFNAKKP
jgi:ubiquinone/menaquinone biosynthesis C-methylase UbiE